MNYKLYILEFLFLAIGLAACLFYFGDQDLIGAISISFSAALLTVGFKYLQDKKQQKNKN